LHAPIRKVLHRRHADHAGKAAVQCRRRQADFPAKRVHRPRPCDTAVNQIEIACDMRVGQTRTAATMTGGEQPSVPSQRNDSV
jgi:hypothetical protein